MSPYDIVKDQMSKIVPYAHYTGVVIEELSSEGGVTTLEQRTDVSNHIGSIHAGAIFVCGEAASGAAYGGAFVDRMMTVRPVAANAQISYLKVAKGKITARAKVRDDHAALKAKLDEDGKVQFAVDVVIQNEDGDDVATMTVDWHVKKLS